LPAIVPGPNDPDSISSIGFIHRMAKARLSDVVLFQVCSASERN
jgi:hypothetical protein